MRIPTIPISQAYGSRENGDPIPEWERRDIRICMMHAIRELEKASRRVDHYGIGDRINWRSASRWVLESYDWREAFRPYGGGEYRGRGSACPWTNSICRLAIQKNPLPEYLWLSESSHLRSRDREAKGLEIKTVPFTPAR